jgi:3-carboxy-cis,cis-muconate cycloisomerase
MMIEVLSGLEVRGEQMLANLSSSRDLITSEWLLFRLSADLGKTRALAKVKALAALAADQGLTLREAVLADPEIGPLFGAADLAPLDRPELYVGRAVALVDQCVAEIRRRRAAGPQPDAARTEGP